MAEVPDGSSGIASALFNSCRQIGTAMGLAILGSIAAGAILADWRRRAGHLPPAGRQLALRLAADVAGGQAHLVAASAGQGLLNPAIASFLRGFEVALLLAGVILAGAGAVGIRGLRLGDDLSLWSCAGGTGLALGPAYGYASLPERPEPSRDERTIQCVGSV